MGLRWPRRQVCSGLVGTALAGLSARGIADPQNRLNWMGDRSSSVEWPNPRDFAAVLDLEQGEWVEIVHPHQGQLIQSAPGSIVKLATATTALQTGIADANRSIVCPGWYELPPQMGGDRWPCWDPRGHGELSLVEALAYSCNVYFYTLAAELGSRRVLAGLQQFGLGLDRASGDPLLLATGQDPHLRVTPWQLLRLIARIARRGQPGSLGIPLSDDLEHVTDQADRIPLFNMTDSIWETLITGMIGAATYGTCQGIAPAGISVAAKTGTILRSDRQLDPGLDPRWGSDRLQADDFQAWVGSFWPVEQPRWAMILYLDRGKAYDRAIPLARRLIEQITHQMDPTTFGDVRTLG